MKIQDGEAKLFTAWGRLIPRPDILETHLEGLKRIHRNEVRLTVAINDSRLSQVIDPTSVDIPHLVSVCGIKFKVECETGVATCHTYQGVPDTVMLSRGIWDDKAVDILDSRRFETIYEAAMTSVDLASVSGPISSYLLNGGSGTLTCIPWSEKAISDLEWLTSAPLPSDLRQWLGKVGCFDAQGFSTDSSGHELWHYPEVDLVPVITASEGGWVAGVSINPQVGLVVMDQENAKVESFGNDSEAWFTFLASKQGS